MAGRALGDRNAARLGIEGSVLRMRGRSREPPNVFSYYFPLKRNLKKEALVPQEGRGLPLWTSKTAAW